MSAKLKVYRGLVWVQEIKGRSLQVSSYASAVGQIEGLGSFLLFCVCGKSAVPVKRGQYLQM